MPRSWCASMWRGHWSATARARELFSEHLIEVFEDERPRRPMALAGCLVRKAGMPQSEARAGAHRAELHGDDRLGPSSPDLRHPGHLDEVRGLEPQEPSVVRMPGAFVTGLEEERLADRGLHRHRAGSCEPAVELFRPRQVERLWCRTHRPLDTELKWTVLQVWRLHRHSLPPLRARHLHVVDEPGFS